MVLQHGFDQKGQIPVALLLGGQYNFTSNSKLAFMCSGTLLVIHGTVQLGDIWPKTDALNALAKNALTRLRFPNGFQKRVSSKAY